MDSNIWKIAPLTSNSTYIPVWKYSKSSMPAIAFKPQFHHWPKPLHQQTFRNWTLNIVETSICKCYTKMYNSDIQVVAEVNLVNQSLWFIMIHNLERVYFPNRTCKHTKKINRKHNYLNNTWDLSFFKLSLWFRNPSTNKLTGKS